MSSNSVRIKRFTRGERWTHRSIAVLMLVLVATAAALYIPDISAIVGNRQMVRVVHEAAGFLLPVPLVLAAILSPAFRLDVRRMNRFRPTDWTWLRSSHRRSGLISVGKFNAGQKLNAAFTLGAIMLMLVTGSVMFFSSRFPDAVRTGATFVHDWLALAVVVVVTGHIYMAYKDATARVGMRTGEVPVEWAQREHSLWAAESQVGQVDSQQS